MGYVVHHFVIVHCSHLPTLIAAREIRASYPGLAVGEIMPFGAFGGGAFLINSSGSKSGWKTAEDHDAMVSGYLAELLPLGADGLRFNELWQGEDGDDLEARGGKVYDDPSGWNMFSLVRRDR